MPFGIEEVFSPLTNQGNRPDGSMDYVVVSGISCRLPQSENMEEFKKHLMKGDNLVTENKRWEPGSHGLPPNAGLIDDISKFDTAFFGVPPKLANNMDPQLRMMLELTNEALLDSGISPQTIRGSNTAVYVGCGVSEAWEALSSQSSHVTGYSPLGCTTSMFANRISFSFDFRGPSYGLRNGCASGLLALDRAVTCIRQGDCDTAIVVGCNLCLKPSASVQLGEMNLLSADGRCKCFDVEGEGLGRSEGVVAMYLQRKAMAKRVYCTVIHSKSATFTTENNNICYPSFEEEMKFLQEMYGEARIDPSHIAYVETSSSCNKLSDALEMNAISNVICRNRKKQLLVGSVKSNIGHTESASGLASVSKIIIAMEEGVIPPTLHYDAPQIPAGQLKVVTEKTRLNGEYCSVNSFGLGSANVHTILKSFSDKTNKYHFANEKRRLCIYSARTKEGLESIFQLMKSHPRDSYLHFLLNETCGPLNKQLPYRGYVVVNSHGHVEEIQKTELEGKRPIWFVFSGMGTQWPKMGRQMMQVDRFRTSIMKCDRALRPHGLQLYDMIMEGDNCVFDKVTNSFVAIAAIQVALTDMLSSMNLKPDGIVGHSVGELGCGYADGCQTAEETVLAAYWRGRCIEEAKLPPGGMAAVGMTWEDAKLKCPEGVVPACHNAKGTVTVSGPVDKVAEFVKILKDKQIFAREVNSAGVAFHSSAMQTVAPRLREEMNKILKPKPRTSKWISSSIPESKWDTELAKTASADYLVNNLVSPVLFQEALKHIPTNAIVIEIAPHGLLQAVLKRSLDTTCSMASLMKREHSCNPDFFFSNLGKCYIQGADFNPLGIFPPVEYPVPRGTAMISPAIKWDHSQSWYVPDTNQFLSGCSDRQSETRFEFDASKNEHDKFLLGHKINGKVLFPAAGYMVLAWKALAKFHGKLFDRMPMVIENLKIHRATIIPPTGVLTFDVTMIPVLGEFEICEGNNLVASGSIYAPSITPWSSNMEAVCFPTSPSKRKALPLESVEVYRELRLRGYDYEGEFRGIREAIHRGEKGDLLWNNNWVTFLDTMMQMLLISQPGLGFSLPTGVVSLKIDPEQHKSTLIWNDPLVVPVHVDLYSETVTAGCVEMQGLKLASTQQKLIQQTVVLGKSSFVPNIEISREDLCPNDLEEYHSQCSALAGNGILRILGMEGMDFPNFSAFEQMAKILKPVKFTETVEKYSKMSKNGLFLILNSLFSMSVDNFVQNSRNILDAYRTKLADDRLMTNLLQPRSLTSCLDIVLENNKLGSLKVLEFASPDVNLTDIVLEHCNKRPEYVNYVKVDGKSHKESANLSPDIKYLKWDIEEDAPENLTDFDILLANNFLHRQKNISKCLQNMSKVLKDDGFLIIHEVTCNQHLHLAVTGLMSVLPVTAETRSVACYCNEEKWREFFHKENYKVIVKKSDGLMNTMFLLRKKSPNKVEKQTVMKVGLDIAESVEAIKKNLKEVAMKPKGDNLWLLVNDNLSGIVGMVNCLRKEPGGEKIRCVLDISKSGGELNLTDGLVHKDLVVNIVKDGIWGSLRHLPISTDHKYVEKSHGYMDITRKGDLSTLQWKDLKPNDDHDKIHCKVHYVSLGTKDLMYALGRLPADQEYFLGSEFSGMTEDGRKVMGVIDKMALATDAYTDRNSLIDIPEGWTLAEAATVTSPFGLAYYSLLMKGKITSNSSLLIADATSSLGQAALAIIAHMRCKIFALVNSRDNLQYLKLKYPSLQNIYVLEEGEQFEGEILRCTKGKGVDVVLTSTYGNLHQQLSTVLRSGGQYLDLSSDYDFNILDKDSLHENITYRHLKTDHFDSDEIKEIMGYINKGIKAKVIQPLDFSCYPHTQIQHAFHGLQDPNKLKSVLVQIREDDSIPISIKTEPKLFSPEKSYILIGGLGGVGLELADWMTREGATKLVFTSRSGVRTGYQERKLRLMRENQIEFNVSTTQVTTEEGCKALFDDAQKLGPIGGIFNLAMVLADGLFENQTEDNFRRVCEPKVNGTKNLDTLTRKYCRDSLDWFVVFSSITSGLGNIGQTNYGYGNSVMERICEQRKEIGLPGLAIQWGAIGDVGVVADKMGGNDIKVGGTYPQRMSSVLETLKKVMLEDHAVVMSYVPAEKSSNSDDREDEKEMTPLESVMKVIGITDISGVSSSTNLIDLGLDSLMTTEIRQNLERHFGIVLPVSDIRKMTVKQLKDYSKDTDRPRKKESAKEDIVREMTISRYIQIPTEEIIPIKLHENDKEPVIIIDLLPGPSDRFMPLTEDIDHSFYVIRCTEDSPLYSVQSLAGHYIQEIDLILPDRSFHLIGYSIGGRIALEIALQKQRQGDGPCVKSLFFLEYPLPLIEKALKELEPGGERDKELLNSLLKLWNLNSNVEVTGSCKEDMIECVVTTILEASDDQLERRDVKRSIHLFLDQIKMMLTYTPDGQYDEKTVIVSPSMTGDLNAQQVVSQYFKQKIQHEIMDLDTGEFKADNYIILRKLLQNVL